MQLCKLHLSSGLLTHAFSLCVLMAIFPGEPWLAGLLQLKMMEVVVTTGATRCAKLQSNHHHQQTNTQFFYRPDAIPVAQPTVSNHLRGKRTLFGLAHSKLSWGLPTLFLTIKGSWLPWRRVAMPCHVPMPLPLINICIVQRNTSRECTHHFDGHFYR